MPEFYAGNRFLSGTEQRVNATYLYQALTNEGWTLNAICGLLGNAQAESTINPGIWQNRKVNIGPGFGLTQWTPFKKYTNWCAGIGIDPAHMDSAIRRLRYEVENPGVQWIPTRSYPETFPQFIRSHKSPSYLAKAFFFNYERARDDTSGRRASNAENWWNYLNGDPFDPDNPFPIDPPSPDEPLPPIRQFNTVNPPIPIAILKRRR